MLIFQELLLVVSCWLFEACQPTTNNRQQSYEESPFIIYFNIVVIVENGDDEFVNETAWDATGRDGSRSDRHQFHYLLSDHAGAGRSGPSDDCR